MAASTLERMAGIRIVVQQHQVSTLDCAFALASLLEKVGPFQLAWVICLPVHGNTVERILQGLTRAGIDHAGLWELVVLTIRDHVTYLDTGSILVDIGDECNFGSVNQSLSILTLSGTLKLLAYLLPSPPSSSNSTS